ncbi:hypothetical protein SDJN02_20474, partial [Cucurbita argyrosperma subsp. argyrosperma]
MIENTLLFSRVVSGEVFQDGLKNPTPRTHNVLSYLQQDPEFKMTLAVEPGFSISIFDTVSISVLVKCKNSNKVTQHSLLQDCG